MRFSLACFPAKAESFAIAAGYHCQLLAQGKHLELEQSSTPQKIHQGCEEWASYSFHTGNAFRHRSGKSRRSTRTELLVGTAFPDWTD
jgi:hypothetical protein